VAFLLLIAACSADAQTLDGAANAYRDNRVAAAEEILARIVADPATSPADRARAWRRTARIAWHIDGDLPRALDALRQADATGLDRCDNAAVLARLLQESGQGRQLVADAETMAALCTDQEDADRIRLRAAEAALELASRGQGQALDAAGALLGRVSEDERGGLNGASLGLELALLQGDAPRALQAWRDYFWLHEADLPQGIEGRPGAGAETFARGLAADAPVEARLQLVELLVRGGFGTAAERFAGAQRLAQQAGGHPLWTRAAAYFEARRALKAELLAANRRQARGGGAGDIEGTYNRAVDRLVAAAGGGDRTQVLRSAYGLYGRHGATDGFAGVHLGHIAQSERRTVDQYGHRAQVSFLALDNMLANGFQTWLWDGDAATGGWAEEGGVIVQVRPEWTSGPLRGWRLVSDGPARARFLERQKERTEADVRAVANGPAVMSGLADRLRLQAADQVHARVKAAAGSSADLRRAFLEEYWRASFQESILAHEGRHAIDKVLVRGVRRLDDANLEYRAKLSQLALAEYPRLGLYNIVSEVGGGGGHGKANSQLIGKFAEWIEAHRREVAGLDPALPAMVQLDKLSDEQIRAIARSLDPIAANHPGRK